MSAIPRAVREQIEALRGSYRSAIVNDAGFVRLDDVLRILDAADREREDARRAHFENDDVP